MSLEAKQSEHKITTMTTRLSQCRRLLRFCQRSASSGFV